MHIPEAKFHLMRHFPDAVWKLFRHIPDVGWIWLIKNYKPFVSGCSGARCYDNETAMDFLGLEPNVCSPGFSLPGSCWKRNALQNNIGVACRHEATKARTTNVIRHLYLHGGFVVINNENIIALADNKWGQCISLKPGATSEKRLYPWYCNPNHYVALVDGVSCFNKGIRNRSRRTMASNQEHEVNDYG